MERRRARQALKAAVAAAVVSACGGQPAAPSSRVSLQLSGAITQPVVTSASPAALTFTLENKGTETVTLNFPTSCQINPYIVESASSRIVVPASGAWGCATVLTTLTLVPNAVALHTLVVRTADAASPQGAVPLPPGHYAAYGRVEANETQLRSESITFVVQ